MKVSGDGNGGYDINVQKRLLRVWGPIMAAVLVVAGGLGSKLGEQAWGVILDREAIKVQITGNKALIEKIQKDLENIQGSQQELMMLLKVHLSALEVEGE